MVNKHFSLGCHACREKHTRCDETKPACRQCTSRGKECPGYRDTNGFLFVDQVEKSRTRRKRKGGPDNESFPFEDTASIVTMTKPIQPDPGYVSVTFFFHSYINFGRNPLTSRGHFDHLLPLHSQARPSSLLALAMELAAGRSMASHYCRSVDSIWHAEGLVRASEAMRSAISDPSECLKDETLLAVLLLDFAEYIKTRRMRTGLSHVHQNAATGLVKLRGTRNFESNVSRSLLLATRSNSLYRAMFGYTDENVDMALLAFMTLDEWMANPALRLDGLIAYVMRLAQRLASALKMKTRVGRVLKSIEVELEKVHGKLLEWRASLPEDWDPEAHTIADPSPGGFGVMGPYPKEEYAFETFSTLDVALIYNQWRCARLLVTKLLRLCRGENSRGDHETEDLIKDVWRSVPFFIHGPKLTMLSRGSSVLEAKDLQQLQFEEPSGLGTWFLGQVLEWLILFLEGDGSTEGDRANATAFRDLREALHSKFRMKNAVSPRSSSA